MTAAGRWLDKIHVGDARVLMRQMAADGIKVQCCLTSPPYYGLRDYEVEGQYGLERTWVRHLARMRDVFRHVHRVLADDGLAWLQYGDSYCASRAPGGVGHNSTINGKRTQEEFRKASRARKSRIRPPDVDGPNRRRQPRIKDKDLFGMPWMVALALRFDPRVDWWLRSDVVWWKKNPMPESMEDRPTKSHEYLFMLAKAERYYSNFEAIAEPCSPDTHARAARGRSDHHKWADGGPGDQTIAKVSPSAGRVPGVNPKARHDGQIHKKVAGWDSGPGAHDTKDHARAKQGLRDSTKFGRGAGWRNKQNESFSAAVTEVMPVRNVRSVWPISTEAFKGPHFATFPRELVRRVILASTRNGDVVFDPFMGTGTVAEVALSLGRHYIGVELNATTAALFRSHRSQQTGLRF